MLYGRHDSFPYREGESEHVGVRLPDESVVTLPLNHGVGRVVELDDHRVVVAGSSESGGHLSLLRLGPEPAVVDTLELPDLEELLLHGRTTAYSPSQGLFGVLGTHQDQARRLTHVRAVFIRVDGDRLVALGHVDATPDDDLRYLPSADPRPLFVGDRSFAVLDDEVVEVRVGDDRIDEVDRVVLSGPTQSPEADSEETDSDEHQPRRHTVDAPP